MIDNYESAEQQVVDMVVKSDDLVGFVKLWKENFIDVMDPQFLYEDFFDD